MSDRNLSAFVWFVADLLRGDCKQGQTTNNTKEQFAISADSNIEVLNSIMGALDEHTTMNTQAFASEAICASLKDVLLNQAGFCENLRPGISS